MNKFKECAKEYAKSNARQYRHNDNSGLCTSEEEVEEAYYEGAKLGYAVRLFEIKDASDKRLEPILKKLLDLKVIKGWYFNGTYHGEG